MNSYKLIISAEEIQIRVSELARQISTDYSEKNPLLITPLKAGFIFLADLIRHLTIPHEIDFISVSSYREGWQRSKEVEIGNEMRSNIEDRDIIIVEGIVDTGHTLFNLIQTLSKRRARSLSVCTLLNKPRAREVDVPLNYVGFIVEDVFVVGYGLDFMERYRNLDYIAEIQTDLEMQRAFPGSASMYQRLKGDREGQKSIVVSSGKTGKFGKLKVKHPSLAKPDS